MTYPCKRKSPLIKAGLEKNHLRLPEEWFLLTWQLLMTCSYALLGQTESITSALLKLLIYVLRKEPNTL